ncbi:hypothetical protein AVEN_45843-1 [Araneus ventricosus]|uniref:Uncharacterized protein n=1 Tax=Araneus ventricosus TaxID=182803 RepID=A0A4Y2Q3Y8_ARAVE|nr:hypothetical protein AVEN_45843-1 [Araneus ventricosus]
MGKSTGKFTLHTCTFEGERVMQAVHGLRNAASQWYRWNLELTDRDCVYYWKYDGTFDGVKATQQLVLNANIEIRKRFALACKYCLKENILNLWTEMEASGKTENLETPFNSMAHFWVRWIRDESRVPWRQAAAEFLNDSLDYYVDARLSAFVPSLRPEERKKFVLSLKSADLDDYLLCLHCNDERRGRSNTDAEPF